MDNRYKMKDEVNINELITEIEKWSKTCRVFIEDKKYIEYYFVKGDFIKEDDDLNEATLTREELFEELSHYNEMAKTRFINNEVVIFDITK